MTKETILATIIPLLVVSAITGFFGGFFYLVYNHRSLIIAWYKKCILKYFPAKFNVALSIKFSKEFNSGCYFLEIKNKILQTIEELDLSKVIKIKDFSDIYLFPDRKEAEEYRQKKDLDLIVWGKFSEEGLKVNNENISKINICFTYSYPKNIKDKENKLGQAIFSDINSSLALKNYWQILESNSYRDVEIISNNLLDVSLYIMGLTLKFYGRLEESREVLEKLLKKLGVEKNNFRDLVIEHLLDCYFLFIRDFVLLKKNYEKGIEYCGSILNLRENSHFALTNIAFFYYKIGKKRDCEIIIERLLQLYPLDPVTEVDVAFIRIIQKNYKNAYKHYSRILRMSSVSFNPQEVIEFLGEEYRICKDPALLYGSGIISYCFGDKMIAKDDLREFLKKGDECIYKEMYRNAKKILDIL